MNIKKWMLGLLVGIASISMEASEASKNATVVDAGVTPLQKFVAGAVLISFLWREIYNAIDWAFPHEGIHNTNTKYLAERAKLLMGALVTGGLVFFASGTFMIPAGQWLFNSFKATPYTGVTFC